MSRKITTNQIKKIKVMQRQLGLEDGDYRLMLWNLAGVKSCKELRGGAVTRVLEHLARCLGELPPEQIPPSPGGAPPGGAVLRATGAQVDKIVDLWDLVTTVPAAQPRVRRMALRNWLRRTLKVHHENFLTADQAQRAIEGLKKMAARKQAK